MPLNVVSNKTVLANAPFLESSFPKVHSVLSKETVANYSLLYTWRGIDANLKPIILMAHQHVVPVDEATQSQ